MDGEVLSQKLRDALNAWAVAPSIHRRPARHGDEHCMCQRGDRIQVITPTLSGPRVAGASCSGQLWGTKRTQITVYGNSGGLIARQN
jgi:hypothetical protein